MSSLETRTVSGSSHLASLKLASGPLASVPLAELLVFWRIRLGRGLVTCSGTSTVELRSLSTLLVEDFDCAVVSLLALGAEAPFPERPPAEAPFLVDPDCLTVDIVES